MDMSIPLAGSERNRIDGDLRAAPDRKAEAEKLKNACRDFEALMTAQMLKSMRPEATDESSGLTLGKNNPLQDIFDWELARVLSEGSPFGIAESLMSQFQSQTGVTGGEKISQGELSKLVTSAAAKYDIDEKLLHAIIRAESGGDPAAVSIRGAKGLMQLTDETAARHGVVDPFDPQQNIEGGANYIRRLLNMYRGNLELTLAAYNAGENAVAKYNGVPPYKETTSYIQRVLGYYRAGEAGSASGNNTGEENG